MAMLIDPSGVYFGNPKHEGKRIIAREDSSEQFKKNLDVVQGQNQGQGYGYFTVTVQTGPNTADHISTYMGAPFTL